MAERQPTGVLIVMSNNADPSRDDEFNDWYEHTHIPEVLATGTYYSAVRYTNEEAGEGEARFVAVYQTDWEDPYAAYEEMKKQAVNFKPSPLFQRVASAQYALIGAPKRTPASA